MYLLIIYFDYMHIIKILSLMFIDWLKIDWPVTDWFISKIGFLANSLYHSSLKEHNVRNQTKHNNV